MLRWRLDAQHDKESATVVGLTPRAAEYRTVMTATAPIEAAMRPIAIMLRTV